MPTSAEHQAQKPSFYDQVAAKLGRLKNFFLPKKGSPATPLILTNTTIEPAIEKTVLPATIPGVLFQEAISRLPEEDLPPHMENMGISAIIGTNETLTNEVVGMVRNSDKPPNGYIFGAGFGNILSMTALFPEGARPKALLAVDVIPDVVVAGRMVVNLLAESASYDEFKKKLLNPAELSKQLEAVIANEPNPSIQKRMREVNLGDISQAFEFDCRLSGDHNISPAKLVPHHSVVDVLSVIKTRFDMFHDLAAAKNISIGYGDMTSPAILDIIKKLPDFAISNNIVYLSNVIDHITARGTNLARLHDIDILKTLGEGNNWFVDTTQNSQRYSLRASHEVPKYEAADVQFKGFFF